MVHVFYVCFIFLFLHIFTINVTDMIIIINCMIANHKSYFIVVKTKFSCLHKLLENFILIFYKRKVQILVFWKVYNDTWYKRHHSSKLKIDLELAA